MLFGHTRHLAATTPIDSEWRLRIAKRQKLSRTVVSANAKRAVVPSSSETCQLIIAALPCVSSSYLETIIFVV